MNENDKLIQVQKKYCLITKKKKKVTYHSQAVMCLSFSAGANLALKCENTARADLFRSCQPPINLLPYMKCTYFFG